MPFSLKKSPAQEPVGLDVDGTYIAAVQAGPGHVSQAASMEAPEGAMRDGEVVDPDAMAGALKELFRASGMPRDVRLGIANQQIVVRDLDLPRIEDQRERDAAVRFQAAEAVAMPLDQAVLDYQVIGQDTSPEGAPRMRVMVVAARRAMVEQLVEAVRGAGLRPLGVDLNAFALVRLLAQPAEQPGSATVYCHLGGVTNLAIAAGTVCRFTRTLAPLGDGETFEAAGALAAEIRPSIDFYMLQPGALPVAGVTLAGPGSSRDGLAEALATEIGMPVEVAEPFGALAGAVLVPGEDPRRHTVATGLALGAAA